MEFDYNKQPGRKILDRGLKKDVKPLVSIITPYYNAGEYLEQTFNCVINQTFPWFEWIIVDDGSTNREDLELLDSLAAKDPRISVYHKENGGISSARNAAIRHAKTDLILPLDADDLLEPSFIEVCWWMLQKNPEAAWAYTDSVGFMGQEYLWRQNFDPEQEKTENLLTATALIRCSALEKIGLYEEFQRHYNEDWVAWLKILAQGGYPVQATGDYLFWYRRSDTGVLTHVESDQETAEKNQKKLKEIAATIKDPHPPVIYPRTFRTNYDVPKMTEWAQSIYREHKKIHVGLLIPWTVMGGADKFNLDLAAGLDRNRFEVGILTTLPSENAWGQRFRECCADVFNLPNFVEPQDYAEFISYYIVSRELDVLVVSNTYIGSYLVPWLRQHFPKLVIVDYVHMEEWYYRKGGHARTSGALAGVLDRTYVCNEATRKVMMEHFGRTPQSVETVHIGVDEALFDRQKVTPGILYSESGIEPGRPVVLFACRLHPQKRPFLMLNIAEKLKEKVPDAAFAVVGDGPEENAMRSYVQKASLENTVYFLGAKSDVRPYYRDARVTLVCSLKEGLSLTAYESCSMGVPIVSADVGGQSDLVGSDVGALIPCLQDEETALENHNYSEQEINLYVDAIENILRDEALWQKMSQNAREKIVNGFTIHNMVQYFENEFTRLCHDPDACAKREKKAAALQEVYPMAADYYTMMAQAETLQNELEYSMSHAVFGLGPGQSRKDWLKQKFHAVLKNLKEYGLIYTLKKIYHKFA